MVKTKRLALLGLLLLVSISCAVAAQATNVLQRFGTEDAELNISTASVSLILSAAERQTAVNLTLTVPQIQQLINAADNYTATASEIFDIQDNNGDITLVPKEGVAQVTVELSTDYGEEFGVQTITATVDLTQNKVTKIDITPEVRRPKVQSDTLLPEELIQNPAEYDGVVVTVSGKVSLLGEVFGSLFMLDDDLTVFYSHPDGSVDVSNIANGDTVTVTGKFAAPGTLYALSITKN
ncbi:MAG: hypothetical protein NWF00_04565 [Candidatus Bathyarchaeota archaeon]|nr:hypothetical protein [Candidatus Bathyarchaeota archaeon]